MLFILLSFYYYTILEFLNDRFSSIPTWSQSHTLNTSFTMNYISINLLCIFIDVDNNWSSPINHPANSNLLFGYFTRCVPCFWKKHTFPLNWAVLLIPHCYNFPWEDKEFLLCLYIFTALISCAFCNAHLTCMVLILKS